MQAYLDNFWRSGTLGSEMVLSLLWIVAAVLLRSLAVRWHFRRHPEFEIEHKRRAMVTSRNFAVVIGFLGLFTVWASQIQTFALSMVALAAATVVATKELIMCLSGSLLRFSTKQYVVGDYIKVNGMRGRVVDITLLNTLMMELGPHDLVGQLSGRTVSFPNSVLLSNPVQRDSVLGPYVVHTVNIPVPIQLDSAPIMAELESVVRAACEAYMAEIELYFEQVQMNKLFITPAAHPRITQVPHDDKVYHIVVRFACLVSKRLEIQQSLLDAYMRLQSKLLNHQPVTLS